MSNTINVWTRALFKTQHLCPVLRFDQWFKTFNYVSDVFLWHSLTQSGKLLEVQKDHIQNVKCMSQLLFFFIYMFGPTEYVRNIALFNCQGYVEVKRVIFPPQQVNCQEAILHISNGVIDKEYCIVHNHSWTPLSQSLDDAVSLLCNLSDIINSASEHQSNSWWD